MFDKHTDEFLRSAPEIPGVLPSSIPQELTKAYARLVAARLTRTMQEESQTLEYLSWEAECYETLARLAQQERHRQASAFVAATAHQIRARFADDDPSVRRFDDELIPAAVSASLLFTIAEQYPDAREAASKITDALENESQTISRLRRMLRWLCEQDFNRIARQRPLRERHADATDALYGLIAEGIRLVAAEVLRIDMTDPTGRFQSAQAAFCPAARQAFRSSLPAVA